MAEEPKNTAPSAEPKVSKSGMSVETRVVTDDLVTSFEGGEVHTRDDAANSLTLGDDLEADDQEAPEADAEGDGEAETEEAPADESDLPDYDPENAEVRAQYDAKYVKEGTLDKEALSADYWRSYEKSGGDIAKSGLPEGVYKYLEDVAGVSRDMAKQIEKALVTDHMQEETKAVAAVAPVEEYNKAIAWGRAGGYSPDQIKRFNEAFSKGGDDRADAIEALMARYERSNGNTRKDGPSGRFGNRNRRPSSPPRDVTGNAGSGGAPGEGGYKSREAYQKDWGEARAALKEARASGDKAAIKKADQALTRIQQKGRRSVFR